MHKCQIQSTGIADGFNVVFERKASKMAPKILRLLIVKMEFPFPKTEMILGDTGSSQKTAIVFWPCYI